MIEEAKLEARVGELLEVLYTKRFASLEGLTIDKKETTTERVAGQMFWELLTGESDYFLRIAMAIGKYAESHGEAYKKKFATKKLQLLRVFVLNYVAVDGHVCGMPWSRSIVPSLGQND